MLPGYVLRGAAISIALSLAAMPRASAQTADSGASQTMAMQALSDICAKEMPDVAKIKALARKRWKPAQTLKGLDYWSAGDPGKAGFTLGAGKQEPGHLCTVSFSGSAADVTPVIEARFKVSKSQVFQGKRIWLLTLNGNEGMVFIEDHPASRLNLNVGIYLEPRPEKPEPQPLRAPVGDRR